tara:strand:+ start:189 stop:680 length:492 start_codon:yes stop_codon:yes gene_type:complete
MKFLINLFLLYLIYSFFIYFQNKISFFNNKKTNIEILKIIFEKKNKNYRYILNNNFLIEYLINLKFLLKFNLFIFFSLCHKLNKFEKIFYFLLINQTEYFNQYINLLEDIISDIELYSNKIEYILNYKDFKKFEINDKISNLTLYLKNKMKLLNFYSLKLKNN